MWKLLGAIVLNLLLFVALPLALDELQWMPPIADKAWVVLACTAIVLCSKTIFGDIVSGSFMYHKHGYDFCITTLGATMAALSVQVVAKENLFTGMQNMPLGSTFAGLASDLFQLTYLFLGAALLISLFATLLTARISRAISNENPPHPDFLAFINFMIGALTIAVYVLLIIVKDTA